MNATQSPEGPPSTGFFRSGNARWVVAVVVVIVLVVGGVLLVRGGSDDDTDGSSATGSSSSSSSREPNATQGPDSSTPGTGSTKAPKAPKKTPDQKVTTQKPLRVPFDATATPTPGVDLEIADVESIIGKAEITGEVGGPALRITLEVTNNTSKPVAINTAVTNLYYGPDRKPASSILRPGSKALPKTVAPGKTVSGKVNYTVPRKNRARLLLEVNLDNAFRTVEFNGSCPRDC